MPSEHIFDFFAERTHFFRRSLWSSKTLITDKAKVQAAAVSVAALARIDPTIR